MKKVYIFVMILTIFITTLVPMKKDVASANPLLARVVGGTVGERVLVGIAEKAGQQYATKTAGKQAIERWNMELYEDLVANHSNIDLRHAEAFKNLNSADVIPIPSKPGYGKVLVSAAMFLTGADVMTDVYNATLTAFNEAGMMERIMDYKQSVSSGSTLRSYRGATTFIRNGQWHFGFNVTGGFMSLASPSYMSPDKPALVNIFNVEDIGYGRMMLYFNYSGFNDKNKVYVGSNTSYVFDSKLAENDWKTIAEKVSETHLPKIAEVPWLQPYTETGIVPNWFPETVEVEIPLTDTDWSTETPTPWNEPLLEPVGEPSPKPETPPGDVPVPGDNPLPGSRPTSPPEMDGNGNPIPVPPVNIAPQPDAFPEPKPETGEPSGGDPDADLPKKKKEDIENDFGKLITNKFPFSLPWDIYYMVSAFTAEPKRPTINFDGGNFGFKFTHDFKWMDEWIPFIRAFAIIGFCMFLILNTRKLLGGGQ